MKPILVHVHIYYTHMWEELKNCIKNIDRDFDLYVTMVENHEELQKEIRQFKPNANIELLENRGFDIGPFVYVINQVNLDNYEYVVKLHTKRDMNNIHYLGIYNVGGSLWRDSLLRFISSKAEMHKAFKNLSKYKVGMISNYKVRLHKRGFDPIAEKKLDLFLEKYSFPPLNFSFVAGTMFIAKAEIFKPLQGLLVLEDFEFSVLNHSGLAHEIERFLGYLVYYNQNQIYISPLEKFCMYWYKTKYFIYNRRITQSGKDLVRICAIPVYWKKERS